MRVQKSGLLGVALAAGLLAGASSARAALLIDVSDGTPATSVVGLFNTGVSGPNHISSIGTANGQYPQGEPPYSVIDNDPASKYLNFGKLSVGLAITPSKGSSILQGLRFQTANDSPSRDPLTFTIEGSNDPNALADGNASWTYIASGLTGLDTDPGRNTFEADPLRPMFANSTAYTSYRLLFTSLRDSVGANSMQIGEVEFLGTTVPEPASMGLLALGSLALLRRRRRA